MTEAEALATQMRSSPQILIVGAGPTGLVLALVLTRRGVPFRIVAKGSGPGEASRAMVLQARTLEFYAQLGIADDVVDRGVRMEAAHLIEGGREAVSLSLRDIGAGMSPYPFALCFPQDDHERVLVDRLASLGVEIEWNTELTSFEQDGDGVRAVLRQGGADEVCEAAYLCGCDGAHTIVRPRLGIGFPGGTYDQLFYVADVALDAPPTGDLVMHLGERSLVMRLPVRSTGRHRLIGIVPPDLQGRDRIGFEDVRSSAEALLGIRVLETTWFSTYRVHHRVADRFRAGRAFLAGDAGHLHSPAGGQGMNTGIGDAVNLSWKLAEVVSGRADPSLLDSYESERLPFARWLIERTDRAFQAMVGRGWTSDVLRRWLLPHLAPVATSLPAVRRALFATLSQTWITYRGSAPSEGGTGEIRGGDRLPWTGDNYASLAGMAWRLHVYGDADPAFAAAAEDLGLDLDRFAWTDQAARAGLSRDAAYLVRPDGHVGLASPEQDPAALRRYADRLGLTFSPVR